MEEDRIDKLLVQKNNYNYIKARMFDDEANSLPISNNDH